MFRPALSAFVLACFSWTSAARTVVSPVSPFYIYSTSPLNTPFDLPSTNPTTHSDIYQKIIAPTLGSCPTKQYIVVLQPSVSTPNYDHESTTPFLNRLATSQTGMKVSQVTGQVNDNWTINTILMDCLHHGVTKVREVVVHYDEKYEELWALGNDQEMIRESVMFVRLPPAREEAEADLREWDGLVEGMVHRWFGNEDYTLFWITQARTDETGAAVDGEILENDGQKVLIEE